MATDLTRLAQTLKFLGVHEDDIPFLVDDASDDSVTGATDPFSYPGDTEVGLYLRDTLVLNWEEGAALADNQWEWSMGNNATGVIGPVFPFDVTLVAWSFDADTSTAGSTVELSVRDTTTNVTPGTAPTLASFIAGPGDTNNLVSFGQFAPTVTIPAGTRISMRTEDEVGTVSDARVFLWLERDPV